MGSKTPQFCPETGFYCPGAQFDSVNDVPGSLPILVSTGGTVTSVNITVDELVTEQRCKHANQARRKLRG